MKDKFLSLISSDDLILFVGAAYLNKAYTGKKQVVSAPYALESTRCVRTELTVSSYASVYCIVSSLRKLFTRQIACLDKYIVYTY